VSGPSTTVPHPLAFSLFETDATPLSTHKTNIIGSPLSQLVFLFCRTISLTSRHQLRGNLQQKCFTWVFTMISSSISNKKTTKLLLTVLVWFVLCFPSVNPHVAPYLAIVSRGMLSYKRYPGMYQQLVPRVDDHTTNLGPQYEKRKTEKQDLGRIYYLMSWCTYMI